MASQTKQQERMVKEIFSEDFIFNQQLELNLGMAIPLSASKAEVSLP
ncbi:MAG: hypothetical protein AABW75_05155 [Nanoarchaeota archaeon]